MKLFWSKRFIRDFKRLIRQNPQIRPYVEKTLQLLTENYADSSLKTHKLKGDLEGCWSCSIDYSNRIIFEFVKDPAHDELAINLLTLGSHDSVY
jgi:addiction module RelE/StbE family toxin